MSALAEPTRVPARLSVSELAKALDVEIAVLQFDLTEKGEPSGPDDLLDARAIAAAARSFDRPVLIEARDLALEYLYESDSRYDPVESEGLPARVERLVRGVTDSREELDKEIEKASKHWAIARMPMIDRAILRLGLWELRNDPETPTAVIVSEAVRLANLYSTGRSGSFVNGVLAALAKSAR